MTALCSSEYKQTLDPLLCIFNSFLMAISEVKVCSAMMPARQGACHHHPLQIHVAAFACVLTTILKSLTEQHRLHSNTCHKSIKQQLFALWAVLHHVRHTERRQHLVLRSLRCNSRFVLLLRLNSNQVTDLQKHTGMSCEPLRTANLQWQPGAG
jgi:hypothetical protein